MTAPWKAEALSRRMPMPSPLRNTYSNGRLKSTADLSSRAKGLPIPPTSFALLLPANPAWPSECHVTAASVLANRDAEGCVHTEPVWKEDLAARASITSLTPGPLPDQPSSYGSPQRPPVCSWSVCRAPTIIHQLNPSLSWAAQQEEIQSCDGDTAG